MGRLFKPTFGRLTLSTLKRCHMDLWFARLVLSHYHRHRLHLLPSAMSPGVRVNSSFFLSVVLFIWQAAFALFQSNLELFSGSPFLSKYFVRAALFIRPTGPPSGYLDCCLIGVAVRQSLSFEALGLRWATALSDLPPPPYRLENHLIWVDSTKRSPLAWCRMSLERIVGTPQFPGYSRDTIIAIMEFNQYCSGD